MTQDTPQRPYLVGLTGGIGSGKTTVTRLLAGLGAEVIDADVISRELLEPGSDLLEAIAGHFGKQLLRNGELDRARLRALVFSDEAARLWLEQLLHPRIRAEVMQRIQRSQRSWLVVTAPLLLESGTYGFVDSIVVVDIPEALQVSRTVARDAVSEEQVRAIMAVQLPRAERLKAAHHIIHNDGDVVDLREQVARLYQRFEETARVRHQRNTLP
jgi:dephospho-CoA kinase